MLHYIVNGIAKGSMGKRLSVEMCLFARKTVILA